MKREIDMPQQRFKPQALSAALLLLVFVAAFAVNSNAAAAQQSQPQTSGAPASGSASHSTSASGSTASSSKVLVAGGEDYRIGANDVLEIQIENAPELSREVRVTAAGTFLMPFLGRIAAQQKTPEELSQMIADQLRGDYLKDPKVTVKVKEYNSRSFFIQGSVRSPSVYQIEGKPSLLELITLAGGLAENHGANAFIIRRLKPPAGAQPIDGSSQQVAEKNAPDPDKDADPDNGPRYELKSVNINALLRGRFEQDMFLEPGDIINIPPTDVFFVAGEVNQPGSFPLKEGTTLRQAIALAQGMKFNAAANRGIVFRENANGKREELPIDIAAVMSGKKEDVPVSANDIIIVPNSRGKAVGGALLRAFGISTVSRVPIP
jgi:protein involved in polysaccharide export with SLBB domain